MIQLTQPLITTDVISDQLATTGYCVIPNFATAQEVLTLQQEAKSLWREGEFARASIGRGANRQFQPEIRSDFIHWLDEYALSVPQATYCQRIDQLRQHINQTLFFNVQEFEAHLAIYPAGAYYKRHLDQHQQTQRRQIACILYLNLGWESADGGQLRIYPEAERWDHFVDVTPYGGTFVCFRCDTIYHEVLPATRERYSLTGWLCRRN